MSTAPEPGLPEVEVTRHRVHGLPAGHSARPLADVVVARTTHGWRAGTEGEWVGPGGSRTQEPVDMDLDTALAAVCIEAATLATAVSAVHPR